MMASGSITFIHYFKELSGRSSQCAFHWPAHIEPLNPFFRTHFSKVFSVFNISGCPPCSGRTGLIVKPPLSYKEREAESGENYELISAPQNQPAGVNSYDWTDGLMVVYWFCSPIAPVLLPFWVTPIQDNVMQCPWQGHGATLSHSESRRINSSAKPR